MPEELHLNHFLFQKLIEISAFLLFRAIEKRQWHSTSMFQIKKCPHIFWGSEIVKPSSRVFYWNVQCASVKNFIALSNDIDIGKIEGIVASAGSQPVVPKCRKVQWEKNVITFVPWSYWHKVERYLVDILLDYFIHSLPCLSQSQGQNLGFLLKSDSINSSYKPCLAKIYSFS